MKTFTALNFLLSVATLTSATPLNPNVKRGLPVKNGYTRTWGDDFNGPAGTFPDDRIWSVTTGTKYPNGPEQWGNNEVQTYARSYANVVITAGQTLSLKATRQPDNTWRSGRIESRRGDFAAREGGKMMIEARLKLGSAPGTAAQGIWPAFWAMGREFREGSNPYKNWPDVTEWDIMESINGQARIHSVVHCGTAPGGVCNEFNGISNPGGKVFSRFVFHTVGFQIDRTMVGPGKPGTWRDEKLNWWLDDQIIFSINGARINDQLIWDKLAHRGHYLIFNIAVGGNWAGPPNAATRSHEITGMEVDYVGVWNL